MNPDMTIADVVWRLDRPGRRYAAGDRLSAWAQLESNANETPSTLEASILWYTAGLGEEDFGVHHFERLRVSELDSEDPIAIETTLPDGPLSYDGLIIKVCWAARLRVFYPNGQQRVVEEPFLLADGDEERSE